MQEGIIEVNSDLLVFHKAKNLLNNSDFIEAYKQF